MKTRSSAQIRSHAQKYLIKLSKKFDIQDTKQLKNFKNIKQSISSDILGDSTIIQGLNVDDSKLNALSLEQVEEMILGIFKNNPSSGGKKPYLLKDTIENLDLSKTTQNIEKKHKVFETKKDPKFKLKKFKTMQEMGHGMPNFNFNQNLQENDPFMNMNFGMNPNFFNTNDFNPMIDDKMLMLLALNGQVPNFNFPGMMPPLNTNLIQNNLPFDNLMNMQNLQNLGNINSINDNVNNFNLLNNGMPDDLMTQFYKNMNVTPDDLKKFNLDLSNLNTFFNSGFDPNFKMNNLGQFDQSNNINGTNFNEFNNLGFDKQRNNPDPLNQINQKNPALTLNQSNFSLNPFAAENFMQSQNIKNLDKTKIPEAKENKLNLTNKIIYNEPQLDLKSTISNNSNNQNINLPSNNNKKGSIIITLPNPLFEEKPVKEEESEKPKSEESVKSNKSVNKAQLNQLQELSEVVRIISSKPNENTNNIEKTPIENEPEVKESTLRNIENTTNSNLNANNSDNMGDLLLNYLLNNSTNNCNVPNNNLNAVLGLLQMDSNLGLNQFNIQNLLNMDASQKPQEQVVENKQDFNNYNNNFMLNNQYNNFQNIPNQFSNLNQGNLQYNPNFNIDIFGINNNIMTNPLFGMMNNQNWLDPNQVIGQNNNINNYFNQIDQCLQNNNNNSDVKNFVNKDSKN